MRTHRHLTYFSRPVIMLFQIDDNGRSVHLGWGPRPDTANDTDLIVGTNTQANLAFKPQGSFKKNPRWDELLTFGDNNPA